MIAEELLKAYPNAAIAISFVELIICQPPEGETESSWDIMMGAKSPMTLAEILETLRQVIKEEVEDGTPGRHAEALAQTYHPEFSTYLAGKMGMM